MCCDTLIFEFNAVNIVIKMNNERTIFELLAKVSVVNKGNYDVTAWLQECEVHILCFKRTSGLQSLQTTSVPLLSMNCRHLVVITFNITEIVRDYRQLWRHLERRSFSTRSPLHTINRHGNVLIINKIQFIGSTNTTHDINPSLYAGNVGSIQKSTRAVSLMTSQATDEAHSKWLQ